MKYLLTLPEIQNEFNLEKILNYSNIDFCNTFFINLKNGKIKMKGEQLIESIKYEKINLKYYHSLVNPFKNQEIYLKNYFL
jgi:hypothetical protein